MNTLRMITVTMFLLSKSVNALAQNETVEEYPSAREVVPHVVASLKNISNGFEFRYHVSNKETALQNIWQFLVEVKTEGSNNITPQDWRVSIIERPNIRAASWGSRDSNRDIAPGDSLSGFGLSSTGLPGIVKYFARGYLEPPEGEIDFKEGTNDIFYNSVKGTTIGPVDPPSPFVALDFLDTIISYKHQSFDLGWIDNQGVVNSLDAKLDNAKKQLERDNKTAAINQLEAFVNEVEAQKDKHLSNEAYALLKFNAEYLIKKLSEP